jgi:hypothetical protein
VGRPAVLAHIEAEHVLLDPRTVSPERDEDLAEAVKAALK